MTPIHSTLTFEKIYFFSISQASSIEIFESGAGACQRSLGSLLNCQVLSEFSGKAVSGENKADEKFNC